jgi:hypothetical protein
METHVKVLGALQIAMGAFGLVGASGDPHATLAVPIIGITGTALVVFLLALSVPGVLVGVGLIGRKPWARVAGIVLSILGMTFVPFGTVLGIYGVWVLFSKDTEKLFAQPSIG